MIRAGRRSSLRITALLAVVVIAWSLAGSAIASTPAVPPWRLGIPWSTETATVVIGDQVIEAQLADTGDLRSRGLGYRDGLAPGTGMLFSYKSPSIHTFWMKGMRFCLDIIWIEGGEIKGAAENACPMPDLADVDLPRYDSPVPVTYILELPAGWLDEHGYGAGTPVKIELPA